MSTDDMNMNIGLRVDTSGEELVDRLTRKLKELEASLRSINAGIVKTSRAAASVPGSASSSTTAQNQRKADNEAKRSARDLFAFRSRLEAQRQREADRSEQYLRRLRVNTFREQERAAAREIRNRIAGEARIAREQRAAQADAARAARAEVQALRDRMSFVNRMAAQRQREEAAIARESARQDRARARDFRSGLSNTRSAASHGRDSYDRLTRTGGAAAAIGVVGTASLARRALLAESNIDAAEINARIYAGLTKDAARQLRDQWASPLAEELGVGTAKLISSYVDAIKVGIPTEGAKKFSALATQTSEAWSVPFEGVVDILGTVNSILTSTGDAFDFGKLKGVANAIQYLSAKQSTTPEKLISYLQRGAGAAQILGMSQEAGLAFGSASTSLGNQAAESGRLADFIAGRIVSLPDLVKKQGLEGTRARELIRHLGYGSAGDLDRQRRADPDAFLPDFVRRFNAVNDTKKQEQLLKFFAGTEWFGEFGRIVKGFEKYKEAADLAKESKNLDAIGEVWSLHRQKLAFVFKQISAGFLNILGEIGKVLSPMARQVGDYFLEWSRKLQGGGLQARVKAAVEGLIEGFGFRDLPEMLRGVFGEPGKGDAGAVETWKSTAKAFADGIRDTLNALKALFSIFTGSNATPETIAKWTGRLLTFAAACVIAAPAVAVLSGLASGITALAVAAFGAWRILKAAGLVGGAAGAAGAAGKLGAGASAATGAGLLGSVARLFGLGAAFGSTAGLSKGDSDALMMRLGEFARKRNAEREGTSRGWIDPPGKDTIDELKNSIDDNTLIHKQSYESRDGFAGLIRKANISSSEVAAAVRTSIQGQAAGLRSGVISGSVGGGIGGSGFSGLGSSNPGSALGNVGIGRRGIIGGGHHVGDGHNHGGATASSAPGRGSANHMHGQYGPAGSNLTTITTNSGRKVTVHKSAAENFKGFIDELEASGYKIKSLGGHAHRSIRGSNRLSQHAYGNAIDINPAQNPMGPTLITDMPKNISDMAAKYGLTWGGDWKRRPDAMHFEWNGRTMDDLRKNGVAGSASPSSPGSGSGTGNLTGLIDKAAASAGIDPRIMHGIRAGESGKRADYDKNITSREESYGPFQLNRMGGLGTIFERETGLSLKDPRTIPQQAAWVANHIKKKLARNPNYNPGSEWYGYRGKMQSDPRWGDAGFSPDLKANAEKALNPQWPANWTKGATGLKGGDVRAPLGEGVPLSPTRSSPGGSSSNSVSAPITINGAGQSPEQIANAVQRRLHESMNRRTHDLDPSSVSGIG